VAEVERVGPIGLSDFKARFERPERPVVIAGGARSLRACELWNPAYLTERFGSVVIPYKLSRSHLHPDFHAQSLGQMFARESSTFAELLHAIGSGPKEERARRLFTGDERFLLRRRNGQTTIDPELGGLLDDVEVPELVPQARLYTVWGWFSGPGVRTWLHYDNNYCHNLNAQITGAKRCWLFPPSELGKLYPFPLAGQNPAHNCSQVDFEAPDLEKFPDFSGAERWEAQLSAGDLLFIPALWLHTFFHEGEFNSNVNFWWKPEQPLQSPVWARQVLLDAVAASGTDGKSSSPHAALLGALDRALQHAHYPKE
jgi:lysine-specific demethylase 8